MSANYGLSAGAGTEVQTGLIQQTRNIVKSCHEMLSELHEVVSEHVGIRDTKEDPGPAAVANGSAEELRSEASALLTRLAYLRQQLKRL